MEWTLALRIQLGIQLAANVLMMITHMVIQ